MILCGFRQNHLKKSYILGSFILILHSHAELASNLGGSGEGSWPRMPVFASKALGLLLHVIVICLSVCRQTPLAKWDQTSSNLKHKFTSPVRRQPDTCTDLSAITQPVSGSPRIKFLLLHV